MSKLQFMVGPPGTGKTSTFITTKYVELLEKFDYKKIIILSHTKVAAAEIRDEILKLPEMQNVTKEALKYNICTIHRYCKKKATIGEKLLDYDDYKNLCRIDSIFQRHKVTESEFENREHGYFKFVKEAYGFNRSLKEHWKKSNKKYHGYSITNIEEIMLPIVENYNKEHGKLDYHDMIKRFIDKAVDPDIDALIVDEAQDSNRTQKIALDKIATNAKEYWFVGDPDQTIFEWAGANAKEFYELSKGAKELEQGHRCSKTINALCKEIIKDVWDEHGTHRIWKPTNVIGNHYKLPSLERKCSALQLLLDKIKNTKETFLFTYRQKPVDAWVRKFLIRHGIQFAYLENSPYVSSKELNCYKLWPEFTDGKQMSLKQIKDFWNYMGSKVIVNGECEYDFEGWTEKDYTINDLIKKKLLKESSVQQKDFTLIALKKSLKKEDFDKKMIYIKKVIRQGWLDEKPRVKYANIHKVKGLTFDNVIVDNSRFQPEDYHTQLRLKYVAYSRGRFDCWTIASQDKYTLGGR